MLLDLPNELLASIFGRLDQSTLRRLSPTSHRFLVVIRTVILTKQILHLQALEISGALSFEGSAIRLLFDADVTSIPFLSLDIKFDRSIIDDLQSIYGLLSRLRHVGHIQLNLIPATKKTRTTGWMHLLAAVLNLVAEKSQTALTVSDGNGGVLEDFAGSNNWGRSMEHPFNYIHHDKPRSTVLHEIARPMLKFSGKLFTKLASAPAIANWGPPHTPDMSRESRPCRVTLSSPSIPLLEEFHLHTSLLLRLPFFHWTMRLLEIAPLRRLTFHDTHLTHCDWEYILGIVTIPTLTHLSLGPSPIAFPDLPSFLARHPSITTLDISQVHAVGNLPSYSWKGILPRLTTLIGNYQFISHLLESPNALPALRYVTLISDYARRHEFFEYFQFDPILGYIAQRRQPITLAFFCHSEVGLDIWMRSLRERVQAKSIKPVPNVISLHIHATFLSRASAVDDFVHLLALFPSLVDLSVTDTIAVSSDLRDTLWGMYSSLETTNGRSRGTLKLEGVLTLA